MINLNEYSTLLVKIIWYCFLKCNVKINKVSIKKEFFLMGDNELKSLFYKMGINLEAKACKILIIMYGISDDDGNVDTSLTDLQQKSNMAISTIRSALKELEEKGILKITHKVGLDTDYKLLFLKNSRVK